MMKTFFAGICLFFSTLFACQQKAENFKSVSADEFDAFLRQLEEGEKDPRVLLARERLMNIKPVWED